MFLMVGRAMDVPRLLPLVLVLAMVASLWGCAPSFDAEPLPARSVPTLGPDVFVAEDGARLPVRRWGKGASPKAVIVAIHGFNDYSHFIDDAAAYFAEHDIHTLAYDQRGFGATTQAGIWPGAGLMAADLRGFLRTVRQEYSAPPLIALGESMGAAVLVKALAEADAGAVDAVILSAPAVWSRDTMPWYQRAGLWIGVRLFPSTTFSGKGLRIVPSDNLEMRRGLSRDPLVIKKTRMDALFGVTNLMDEAVPVVPTVKPRTLLLYGAHDEVIPKTPMRHLLENVFSADRADFRFAYYPEGYHMLLRDLQRKVVWDDVVSWALRPEARLPSGQEVSRQRLLQKIETPG